MARRVLKDPLENPIRQRIAHYVRDAPEGIREGKLVGKLREEELLKGKTSTGFIHHLHTLQRTGYVKIVEDRKNNCTYIYPLKGGPLDKRIPQAQQDELPAATQTEQKAMPYAA